MYKTISVDVDVDFDDLETDDLVDELCKRIRGGNLSKKETLQLKNALQGAPVAEKKKQTLYDILMSEMFEDAAQRYSLVELQKRLA
jgi:hypothetical protein